MSSYVVDVEHINTLVWAGLLPAHPSSELHWYWGNPTMAGRLDITTADAVGAMLLEHNVRAVNERYSEDTAAPDYTYRPPLHRGWSPVDVLSALGCYEYQASDAARWRDSEACAFAEALRLKLIALLPGYADAPWSITVNSTPVSAHR